MRASSLFNIPLLFGVMVLLACNPSSGQPNADTSLGKRIGQQENSNDSIAATGTDINIMATTPIVAEWVNQIGGARLSAASIIPYGTNPHSYQPGAKDLAAITRARYIFAIGMSYEDIWLTKLLASHPETIVVELSEFSSPIEFRGQHRKNQGRYDPHFWFDPLRVISVIGEIAQVLSEIDPDGAAYYTDRAKEYTQALRALDGHISTELGKVPEARRKLLSEHESLGYLGERYNILILQAVIPNLSSETGPTPKDLTEAIELVQSLDVPVIFVETETTGKSAQRIAQETGARVAVGLSVETLKEGQSYIDFMKYNLEVIISNLVD